MSVNFRDLLSKPTDNIKKPKALPIGTYRGVIVSKAYDVSKQKQTPFVRLILQPSMAESDVAQEDLEGINISSKQLRADFYLTDDASYRVLDLAKGLGIPTEGRSLGEVIEDLPNHNVLIAVTQQLSQDGSEVYNNVNKLTALD